MAHLLIPLSPGPLTLCYHVVCPLGLQRVTCDRTALKTAHRSTVLVVLGIEHTHIGFAEAKTHILQTSYIYPVGKTESANKHKYHKFMHKMYLTTFQSIAPATHGLTRDEILDRIQDSWADFEADNDDN
ncbi:hypothetical protein K435DRAFT_797283 [Dendrothele bispora CBS 962.96]|uniref:Uncharacterized protein n=1 Tax=Dendrothele bispora (strain CBS 962.96) TaxID=1314807 RepID=A0A4S8M326_DENBC|nr:hypothetical protein K435DRAFT_797283 [Dendrothele bispora CBS 962.96]